MSERVHFHENQSATFAENLYLEIKKRITTPVIQKLYDEFVQNGTYQALIEILNFLPPFCLPPIFHTLTTHVTKEKPVFVYGIVKEFSGEIEKRKRFIAASTDFIWCLSLMIDDIVDKDTQRAGRETAWVIFGREKTYQAAQIAYQILQNLTETRISSQAKNLLVECVEEGLSSLSDPQIRSLPTATEEALIENITRRARFHCEYPLRVLSPTLTVDERLALAIEGLHFVNLGGQILNDLKDLVISDLYGRPPLSDIKGGIVTIPLLRVYRNSTEEEKALLEYCLGQPTLVDQNIGPIIDIVALRLPKEDTYALVGKYYQRFLDLMGQVISPDYFPFCSAWVDYKLDQAHRLLFSR